MKPVVGIIGIGFVGNAIMCALADKATLVLRDNFKGYSASYGELAQCEAVFICVPTPQSEDGTCDTSPLESVLEELGTLKYEGTIISKCTAPPAKYGRLQGYFPNLVHVPEFLTAANAVDDYANGEFAFVGGDHHGHMDRAASLVYRSQPNMKNVNYCSIEEAALAKYTINSFLATKVTFMNEIQVLAKRLGCDYDTVASMVAMDKRIGTSHMQVPGPDGMYGFGGACFPKDTSALLRYASDVGVPMTIVRAAVAKNVELRAWPAKE